MREFWTVTGRRIVIEQVGATYRAAGFVAASESEIRAILSRSIAPEASNRRALMATARADIALGTR